MQISQDQSRRTLLPAGQGESCERASPGVAEERAATLTLLSLLEYVHEIIDVDALDDEFEAVPATLPRDEVKPTSRRSSASQANVLPARPSESAAATPHANPHAVAREGAGQEELICFGDADQPDSHPSRCGVPLVPHYVHNACPIFYAASMPSPGTLEFCEKWGRQLQGKGEDGRAKIVYYTKDDLPCYRAWYKKNYSAEIPEDEEPAEQGALQAIDRFPDPLPLVMPPMEKSSTGPVPLEVWKPRPYCKRILKNILAFWVSTMQPALQCQQIPEGREYNDYGASAERVRNTVIAFCDAFERFWNPLQRSGSRKSDAVLLELNKEIDGFREERRGWCGSPDLICAYLNRMTKYLCDAVKMAEPQWDRETEEKCIKLKNAAAVQRAKTGQVAVSMPKGPFGMHADRGEGSR